MVTDKQTDWTHFITRKIKIVAAETFFSYA